MNNIQRKSSIPEVGYSVSGKQLNKTSCWLLSELVLVLRPLIQCLPQYLVFIS
jgi:hypothetical protein